jgi:hypothetical protein
MASISLVSPGNPVSWFRLLIYKPAVDVLGLLSLGLLKSKTFAQV